MIQWHELSEESKLAFEKLQLFQLARFQYNDKTICVAKLEDGIYGIHNSCPHAGAQLHHGHCNRKGVVGCPLHGYKFDIKTGRSTDGNNYKIASYQFKMEDDKLYIGWKSY